MLPKEAIEAEMTDPGILWLYSSPKVGKTTALSLLPNNLIFDLEKGTRHLKSLKVHITSLEDIKSYGAEILAEYKSTGKYPYDFLSIDTVTKLEDMILPLAGKLYRETAMGKSWGRHKDGTINNEANVLTLPNGAGYLYLREAFAKLKSYLLTLAPRLIMSGHLKDKLIGEEGKEVSAKDIDLTGKIRNIECANADAIGYLYRKGNTTILSFKTKDDTLCGARPKHLKNKDVVLVEEVDDKFIHNWQEIYPEYFKK